MSSCPFVKEGHSGFDRKRSGGNSRAEGRVFNFLLQQLLERGKSGGGSA